MAWGLKIRGMGKGHIEERVKEAARILELDGLLKRRPRELSGGLAPARGNGARYRA